MASKKPSQAGVRHSRSDSARRLAPLCLKHAEERRLSKTDSALQLLPGGRTLLYLKEAIVSRSTDRAPVRRFAIDRIAADVTDKDPLF